jgi:hypothetical protein
MSWHSWLPSCVSVHVNLNEQAVGKSHPWFRGKIWLARQGHDVKGSDVVAFSASAVPSSGTFCLAGSGQKWCRERSVGFPGSPDSPGPEYVYTSPRIFRFFSCVLIYPFFFFSVFVRDFLGFQ